MYILTPKVLDLTPQHRVSHTQVLRHLGSYVDHFWATMAEQKNITDSASLRFGTLAQLAKTLLVLPHSNAEPDRLFSMVRKFETEQRKRLDPSTVCDLPSTKINDSLL